MEHPDRRSVAEPRGVIAHLQRRVLGWIDGDRVLPADGSFLLATLERALGGLDEENGPVARAGVEAFAGRVEVLVEKGVLTAADGHLSLEAARAFLVPDG